MADLPIFPLVPSKMSINLVSNSKAYESTFNRSTTTHKFPGARWKATLTFDRIDNMNDVDEIEMLQAFIWSLEGMNGRFLMRPYGKKGRPARGEPKVLGANQYGALLQTDGWHPNTLVAPRGSYFSVGDELKFITEDIYSTPTGTAILKFTPWLRNPPNDNDEIVTDEPMGIFRLVDDNQGQFDLEPGLEANLVIEVVEAFNV